MNVFTINLHNTLYVKGRHEVVHGKTNGVISARDDV